MEIDPYKYALLLCIGIALSFVFHVHLISQDIQGLHSWRQSQTMWNIRNFVRHDGNILNPRTNTFNGDHDNIYRYEFPIMQWSIAMAQKVLGEKIQVVRVIVFLIGALAVVGMYFITCYIIGDKYIALITSFLFQFSPIFYYYNITPLPDILALTSGIWYIYFMLKFRDSWEQKDLVFASIFLVCSTLAKLPYLMFAIISWIFFYELLLKKETKKVIRYAAIQVLILVPAILWYAWVMPSWSGNPVLMGIFNVNYSAFEFLKLIGFHAIKFLPNKVLSFPVWVLFLLGSYWLMKSKHNYQWLYGLIGITSLYLLLQLTTIGRDHDYYLLPFLPWLFIVVSIGVQQLIKNLSYSNIVFALMCGASVMYTLHITKTWDDLSKTSFNVDVFRYSTELKKAVPDDALCIILNDPSGYIFSYRIDKMGYVFRDDFLPVGWIDDLVRNHGIQYMYSDSPVINTDENVKAYIDQTLLTRESVVVYKLSIPDDKDK